MEKNGGGRWGGADWGWSSSSFRRFCLFPLLMYSLLPINDRYQIGTYPCSWPSVKSLSWFSKASRTCLKIWWPAKLRRQKPQKYALLGSSYYLFQSPSKHQEHLGQRPYPSSRSWVAGSGPRPGNHAPCSFWCRISRWQSRGATRLLWGVPLPH